MMQVNDRDDAKELTSLRACREELLKLKQSSKKNTEPEVFQKL